MGADAGMRRELIFRARHFEEAISSAWKLEFPTIGAGTNS
jgi:hypothetical protein